MNITEKLLHIQKNLKAPKNQVNSFAGYKYRSLEDITEAVKPLLTEIKAVLVISDEPYMIGDRIYIKATAMLVDTEDSKQYITNTACAREPLSKKGSDDSQITGATSSYARKYCLNGLFCIDDNKDADSMPHETPEPKKQITIGKENVTWLSNFCKQNKMDEKQKKAFQSKYTFDSYKTTPQEFEAIKQQIEADYANL